MALSYLYPVKIQTKEKPDQGKNLELGDINNSCYELKSDGVVVCSLFAKDTEGLTAYKEQGWGMKFTFLEDKDLYNGKKALSDNVVMDFYPPE